MTALVAGQNLPWPHDVTQVLVADVDVVVLPLGGDDRADPVVPVLRAPGGVHLTLSAVPEAVERLLVLGLRAREGGVVRLGSPTGAEAATFASPASGIVALVEFYRRAGAWKVRAIGRAYAVLADVERLHGVHLEHEVAPSAVTPQPGPAPQSPPGGVDAERAVQLIGMILEDAARSGASYLSSVSYAEQALETEESAIVADPAMRVSAEGERARAAARARRDDLVQRAQQAHLGDLAKLNREITDVERSLPPAMRAWASRPQVGARDDPPIALRAGDLTLEHLAEVPGADFRLPMVWRVPSRPLLISHDEGGPDAAMRIAAVIGVRAVAALARHRPRLVLVDLGGHRGTLGLPAGLAPTPLTSAPALTRLLADLIRRAELIEVAARNNAVDALDAELLRPIVVVLVDTPTLWEAEAVPLMDRLVAMNPGGVQIVLTGPDEYPRVGGPAEQRLLEAVWAGALRLPSAPGGQLADAFASVSWRFLPDHGPADPGDLVRLVEVAGPFEGWREGIVPA